MILMASLAFTQMNPEKNPERNAYFGELHIHSSWSNDAYVFGTRIGPEDATKYAMGQPVIHPGGFKVQLKQPLDFTVVMDHSEYTGALTMADDPNSPLRKNSPILADTLRFGTWANGMDLYKLLSATIVKGAPIKTLQGPEVAGYAWKQIAGIAGKYYQPCKFTTFPGWEWTSTPDYKNLHRIVFFKDPAHVSPSEFSSLDSTDPAAGLEGLETVTVPLKIVNIGDESVKVYKIGIELRLGGGEPRLYTFDTGSSGFYAARNRDWWPSFERVGGPRIEQSYGDATTFRARIVRTTVAIPTNLGEVEAEVEVGQIMNAWGGALGPRNKSTWRKNVKAGEPPLFRSFFGDFGSGLTEKNGLFAVLPQLPGNLSSGFALRLGCMGSPSSTPTLEIGLTEAIRSQVTSWVPMLGGAQSPPFPNSGLPTYGQKLLAGHFSLKGDGTDYAFSTGAILDTGGPTTSLHEHGDELKVPDALLSPNHQKVRSDVLFRVTAEGTEVANGFDLEFTTGTVPGFNEIDVTQSDQEAFVNLGLIPFFRYYVVFDVERGLVGFAPCAGS